MIKDVSGQNVYYQIVWSQVMQFDKYRALGIPDMPGILSLLKYMEAGTYEHLLFYFCWRSGVRKGLKDITDENFSRFPGIIECHKEKKLYYRYTVIDTSVQDMNDIMFWLIKEYLPLYNNSEDFTDSKRYREIYLKETVMDEHDVIERIKKSRT